MHTRAIHLTDRSGSGFAHPNDITDALNGIVGMERYDQRFSVTYTVVRVLSFQLMHESDGYHVIALAEVETKK
jgi:hypothetical protein